MRTTTTRNVLAAICMTATLFLSFENEHPVGNTGSPLDGICSDCHTPSGNFSGPITFEFNDLGANSYIYTDINVGVAAKFGFQISALDDNDAQVGSFVLTPSDASLQTSNGIEYLGHQPAQFSSSGSWGTEAGWDPQGFTGDVHFYIAWLAANNDGTNSGDDVFFDEFVFSLGASVLPLTVEINDSTDPLCNGDDSGVAIATAAGGVMPYEYEWSNGGDEATAESLEAGTYTVTVTDDAGSTATADVTLDEPDLITLEVEQGPTDCFASDEGFIEVAPSGGVGDYTYDWGVFGDDCCLYDIPAAFYTVTVSDENNCSVTETYEILEPSPLSLNVSTSPLSMGGAMDASATAFTFGGTPGYQYDWSNGQQGSSINNLGAGTYTVTVTDSNNCEAEQTIVIMAGVICDLALTVNAMPPTCYPDSIGTLAVSGSGGLAPYGYVWPDGSSLSSFTGTAGQSYSVTVNDANGCSLTRNLFLAQPDSLIVNTQLLVPNECPSGNAGMLQVQLLGGHGNYTLTWSNGLTNDTMINGLDTLVNIPDTLMNLVDGYLSYELVDGLGCTKVDSILIYNTDNIPPVLMLQSGTVTIDASGQSSGLPNVNAGSTDNCGIASLEILGAQNFSCGDIGIQTVVVQATDINGNTATATTTLQILDEIAPVITCPISTTAATCLAIDYELPTVTDNCDIDPELILTDGLPPGAVFPAGITEVIYTARDECGNEADCSFTVEILSDLRSDVMTTPTECGEATGTMTIDVSGGVSPYEFTSASANLEDLPAGDYSITVTDSNGCSVLAEGTISSLGGLFGFPLIYNYAVCEGDLTPYVITIDEGVAPYIYSVNGGAEEISEDGNIELEILQSGSINISVADADGCAGDVTVQAIVNQPTVDQFTIQLSCSQSFLPFSDAPLTTGVGIIGNPTELPPGFYNLTRLASDANGCGAVGQNAGTLTVIAAENFDIIADVVNSSCSTSDGQISLSVSGGVEPYSYVPFGPTQSGLGAGSYTIVITDAAGCSAEEIVVVTQENAPLLIVTESFICHEANDGTIGLQAQGGTPPYEYFLGFISQNTPLNGPHTIENLPAGGYNVRVVDAQGCEDRSTAVVRSHPELIADLVYQGGGCQVDPAQLVPEIMGGILPYTPIIEEDAAQPGLWLLSVTDGSGCTAMSTYDAGSGAPLDATLDIQYSCDGSVTTDLMINGGCPPYAFSNDVNDLPGAHLIIVSDSNGDEFILNYEILEIQPITSIVDVVPVSLGSLPSLGSASAEVTGGLEPYSYVWLNQAGDTLGTEANLIDIAFTMAQDVTFIVIDDLGCADSLTVTIDVTTAVGELRDIDGFKVYPNPVSDQLIISDVLGQEAQITIYNYSGQQILKIYKTKLQSEMNISTQEWSSGLYYIKINTKESASALQIIKI